MFGVGFCRKDTDVAVDVEFCIKVCWPAQPASISIIAKMSNKAFFIVVSSQNIPLYLALFDQNERANTIIHFSAWHISVYSHVIYMTLVMFEIEGKNNDSYAAI